MCALNERLGKHTKLGLIRTYVFCYFIIKERRQNMKEYRLTIVIVLLVLISACTSSSSPSKTTSPVHALSDSVSLDIRCRLYSEITNGEKAILSKVLKEAASRLQESGKYYSINIIPGTDQWTFKGNFSMQMVSGQGLTPVINDGDRLIPPKFETGDSHEFIAIPDHYYKLAKRSIQNRFLHFPIGTKFKILVENDLLTFTVTDQPFIFISNYCVPKAGIVVNDYEFYNGNTHFCISGKSVFYDNNGSIGSLLSYELPQPGQAGTKKE
jgi:hypothetical protein